MSEAFLSGHTPSRYFLQKHSPVSDQTMGRNCGNRMGERRTLPSEGPAGLYRSPWAIIHQDFSPAQESHVSQRQKKDSPVNVQE